MSIFGQDVGSPVFKKETFYTIGGGLIGTALGLAFWATDPLNPGTDLRGIIFSGFAYGSIIGFVTGAIQLSDDSVTPGSAPNPNFQDPTEEDIYGMRTNESLQQFSVNSRLTPQTYKALVFQKYF